MNFIELNRKLQKEYNTNQQINTLLRYVLSEMLPPIEDYENVIRIIRDNYRFNVNSTLLMIGSYTLSEWSQEENEMLHMLNSMSAFLTNKERAITSFLNAHYIRFRDKNYMNNKLYRNYLLESVNIDVPFVFNRLWLAEISSVEISKKLKEEALNCVMKVSSSKDINELNVQDFVEPEFFLNEKILGTHISEQVFDYITRV